MIKFHKLKPLSIFLTIVFGSVFLNIFQVKAASTIYVSTAGTNNATCGISSNPPCRTIEYAVEQRAQNGDLVSINDGTYIEAQIAVPEGVSLTSTSANKLLVIVKPAASYDAETPFLNLVSASPGSNGNQAISHITINGVNGSYAARTGIRIANRNNVRVHHCDILNTGGVAYGYALDIKSTQIARTNQWWTIFPADTQAPGTNTNIDQYWPSNPIQNIEIDNNTITNCGFKASVDSASGCVSPYNIKNSTIHHNTITSGVNNGEPIASCSGIFDNVDIYNNTFTMSTVYSDRSSYVVEIWVMKNGCEVYNNVANNGSFSIVAGKETKVYDNVITYNPAVYDRGGIGIEFIVQSYGEVYGNFISGVYLYGITLGADHINGKNWIAKYITIRNNVIYNTSQYAIGIFAGGPWLGAAYTNTTDHVDVYHNVIDGQTSTERGDAYFRTTIGVHVRESNNLGTGVLQNVNIKNNVFMDITGNSGVTQGTISGLVIDNNRIHNTTSAWSGSTPTNTSTADPQFTLERTNFIGYTPSSGSNLIDAGVALAGYPYNGSAPDLGAIEYQSGSDTIPPSMPTGLSVE